MSRSGGHQRRRAVRAFGALSAMTLVGASFGVAIGLAVETAPAGAAGTAVIAETFQNANVTSPSSWVRPPGTGRRSRTSACLTAGNNTSQTPIPDCSSDGAADGNGVLRLTDNVGSEEGGALTSLSVPASNGLDATFNSYQYGGGGADGIGFVIAAEDPSNPDAPTQLGQPGGDLGYSGGTGTSGTWALPTATSVSAWTSSATTPAPSFDGTGCSDPSWAGANPGQVVVRGPGNAGVGYCLVDSSANERGGTQNLHGSSRSDSVVPVEVVLNTTSAAVPMSGSQFTTDGVPDSVPAGDYGVAWVPLDGSPEFYVGPLPSTTNGGIPSGLYPEGWINPTTGIPYQLGFGWVGSTGAVTDVHEVSNVVGHDLATGPRAQRGHHRQRQRTASRRRFGRLHPAGRRDVPAVATRTTRSP